MTRSPSMSGPKIENCNGEFVLFGISDNGEELIKKKKNLLNSKNCLSQENQKAKNRLN